MEFIKEYWTQIIFVVGIVGTFLMFAKSMVEATKCSLRNDILDIYDRCKETGTITYYQLESIKYSSELYFKLRGNSFVKDVVDRVSKFKLVD